MSPNRRLLSSEWLSFTFSCYPGGASGIGAETVRVLALRGAHVIIAARNLEAANNVKQLILKDNGAARVDVLKLDLCSLKSVREFSDCFLAMDRPLNILMYDFSPHFPLQSLSLQALYLIFSLLLAIMEGCMIASRECHYIIYMLLGEMCFRLCIILPSSSEPCPVNMGPKILILELLTSSSKLQPSYNQSTYR